MARILLCQLDGKLPNIALMRIAAEHRRRGDDITLKHGAQFEASLFDDPPDRVYASAIFRTTIPLAERLKRKFPNAILGGTGVDPMRPEEPIIISPIIQPQITAIEDHGFHGAESALDMDYSLYPDHKTSIGFTQRGCRLNCRFCCVRSKEGEVREVNTVHAVWRGEGFPRHIHLLDNDFFGQKRWRQQIEWMREGKFKVSFNQGINARFLTDEAAEAIASVDYVTFRKRFNKKTRKHSEVPVRRLYTAWDNLKDEERLFDGLRRLVRYGVKPDHIMVYVLIGYWPGETNAERIYRIQKLLDFGARPYPMPFRRTPELVGMQRWAVGAYAKDEVEWEDFEKAKYQPANLGVENEAQASLF